MKKSLVVFLGAAIVAISVPTVAQAQSQHVFAPMPRMCIPGTATATRMQATTGADADSGALAAGTCWMLEGDSDAWAKWGTSAVTAAANDFKLRSGKTYVFCAFPSKDGTAAPQHVSLLSVAVNGDWRILECR